MSRIAYVNGRYLPFAEAKVHVEDRGYQFGDGVYEVCEVRRGQLIYERRHLERLKRSLGELRIDMPMSPRALGVVMHEVVARNRIGYGIVYLQITRGVARRDDAFPSTQVRPSVVVTARTLNKIRNEAIAKQGIAVVTVPDNRWGRVDIKTIGLLPNVLARQTAVERRARDAWFVDAHGMVWSAGVWVERRFLSPLPICRLASLPLRAQAMPGDNPRHVDLRQACCSRADHDHQRGAASRR